jgi:hypothetical protein
MGTNRITLKNKKTGKKIVLKRKAAPVKVKSYRHRKRYV